MDLLREYAASSDGAQSDSEDERMRAPISFDSCKSLAIPKTGLDVAPAVVTRHDIGGTACVDPRTKELDYNPKYEELFQPIAGPSNPFKSSSQSAHKNMLTGYVETAHVDSFQFDQQIRAFDTLGYARDPSADQSNKYIGDVQRAKEKQGASLVEGEKTGGEKRKRVRNMDASDVNGPWARFEDEELVSKPEGELAKEMEEIVRKRQKNSRAGRRAAEQQQQGNFDEASTLHCE
ncbi:unnamed protein product [Toxocara canis]|uniref:LsmAD domain-containing protein n=1 Tax=Toxocara canis TaxID=6265 RepID=A0A183VES2_TOXCA|nr:unnamed protein product [Toxocara canis]